MKILLLNFILIFCAYLKQESRYVETKFSSHGDTIDNVKYYYYNNGKLYLLKNNSNKLELKSTILEKDSVFLAIMHQGKLIMFRVEPRDLHYLHITKFNKLKSFFKATYVIDTGGDNISTTSHSKKEFPVIENW